MAYLLHIISFIILLNNLFVPSYFKFSLINYPTINIIFMFFIYGNYHCLQAIYIKDINTFNTTEKKNTIVSTIKLIFYNFIFRHKEYIKKLYVLPNALNHTKEEPLFNQKTIKETFIMYYKYPFIYCYQHLLFPIALIITWSLIIYNTFIYDTRVLKTIMETISNLILSIQEIPSAEAMEDKKKL